MQFRCAPTAVGAESLAMRLSSRDGETLNCIVRQNSFEKFHAPNPKVFRRFAARIKLTLRTLYDSGTNSRLITYTITIHYHRFI